MRWIIVILSLFLCCGCTSVVNIPQKYPAEHAAMTKDQAVEIVKKCFLPSEEASGVFQVLHETYYWKDFDDGQMTADGFSFLAYHAKTENYVDSLPVGKDRYGNEHYIKVLPGTPDSVKRNITFKEIYTSEWRFAELKRVYILPITASYTRGEKPRGGYQVGLVWKNPLCLEERSAIDIIVSEEDGPRFLLAVSKLAPQAKICVYNFNKAKLPSKLAVHPHNSLSLGSAPAEGSGQASVVTRSEYVIPELSKGFGNVDSGTDATISMTDEPGVYRFSGKTEVVLPGLTANALVNNNGKTINVNPESNDWGPGARHTMKGQVVIADYVFLSSAEDPLVFKVVRNRGYVYERGRGTVITPRGEKIYLDSAPFPIRGTGQVP